MPSASSDLAHHDFENNPQGTSISVSSICLSGPIEEPQPCSFGLLDVIVAMCNAATASRFSYIRLQAKNDHFIEKLFGTEHFVNTNVISSRKKKKLLDQRQLGESM